MYRILIIDDDQTLRSLNKIYLEKVGYQVWEAETITEGLQCLNHNSFDCIILDISLPDGNGYDACRQIKQEKNIPIIFISNHSEEESRIHSFISGGDDFMNKPYSLRELELRIQARVRQYYGNSSQETLCYPPITLEKTLRCVTCDSKKISFTGAEFNILYFLASHPNEVYSSEEIYNQVWNQPSLGDTHTVQVHLAQARKKVNALREGHNYIETIWGKGYKFNP